MYIYGKNVERKKINSGEQITKIYLQFPSFTSFDLIFSELYVKINEYG